MAPQLPAVLTTERGAPGVTSANGWIDNWEETAELRWPHSTMVYDRMRKTDGQTAAVMRAYGLPIRRTKWRPTGSQVDPRVRALVEAEFGLQLDDKGRRRRRREGISWDEHLRHALLMVPIGHMPFEQVYEIGPPPPGIDGLPPVIAHLRKLSPRMPRTLTGINVAADGALESIRQLVTDPASGFMREVTIPVAALLMYCNDREGADWTGTSILRAAYKHWLIKDQLLRLSAMAAERNSMGLPVVGFGTDGNRSEALRIGRAVRAGEDSAVAVPDGYTFELKAVQGDRMDLLPLIEYHDQAIGRTALTMFLNLGHDGGLGHGSLGDTFVDFFTLALWGVVAEVEETATEYAVRDFVALNFGPDEPYPPIVADEIEPGSQLTADALSTLASAGVITPDDPLEEWVRRRGGAPAMGPKPPGPAAPPTSIDPNAPAPDPNAPPTPPGAQPPAPPVRPDAVIPPPARAASAPRRTVAELEERLDYVRRQLHDRAAARR